MRMCTGRGGGSKCQQRPSHRLIVRLQARQARLFVSPRFDLPIKSPSGRRSLCHCHHGAFHLPSSPSGADKEKTRGIMGCSSGSVPKKARTTKVTTIKCNPTEHEEQEICNVFTVEMDNLECDICFMPFESQVYSCKNGHAACGKCCTIMGLTCPSCSESIGDFRCRATEKILAGMTRPCRFKKRGCRETVRYTEARRHEEEVCLYSPYRCPFDGCDFRGYLLYSHIIDAHEPGATSDMELVTLQKSEPFRALLPRDSGSVFLLLNGGDVLTGRSLSVVRLCPYPEEEEDDGLEVKYTMEVMADELGSLLSLASATVPFVRRLDGYKAKVFLFVPDAFWGSSGSVAVTLDL